MEQVPEYNSKKLLVLHSVNRMGARRTEVWTLEDFEPGTLIFAPVSLEITDRMYTHLAASHLALPKKNVPGNKLMALDGRNLGHLSHVHPSQHRAYATGSLFWCITRTQDETKANLVQKACQVTVPKVSATVPGLGTTQTKLAAEDVPHVQILTNLALVKAHTRLVAMGDTVVAKARETEKALEKAKVDAEKAKAQAEKEAKEERGEGGGAKKRRMGPGVPTG